MTSAGESMNVKLLVLQGRPAGKTILFGPGEYLLGRGPECHLRFNSDWVSRQHCQLRVGPAGAVLRDLGSRNGTLLNGELLDGEHALADGDQIQLGPVVFEVRLERRAAAAAGPAAEIVRPADQDSSTPEKPLDSTAHHPAVPPPAPEE
jgi:pSer/pThr/pTyr-binding forkhead associated (FHA) protein